MKNIFLLVGLIVFMNNAMHASDQRNNTTQTISRYFCCWQRNRTSLTDNINLHSVATTSKTPATTSKKSQFSNGLESLSNGVYITLKIGEVVLDILGDQNSDID